MRLRRQILAAAAANGADDVRVFGSVARGEESADSDVDFLVVMKPGHGLLDLTRLELELEKIMGRRVDVVTVDGLHEAIRETAVRQAVLV